MNNFLKPKPVIFILAIIGISMFLLISISSLFSSPQATPKSNTPFASPTTFQAPPIGDHDAQTGFTETAKNVTEGDRSALVLEMTQDLPYTGSSFSLYYNYDNDQFTLYINPSSQLEGDKEFTSFLKAHQIDNKSWIKNIVTTYTDPTTNPLSE